MATLRQKKAVAILAEKGGSVRSAMRKAGYSKKTNTPKKLTESKGFRELLSKYLPDELLAKKHAELLTVPIKRRVSINGVVKTEEESLDVQAVSKGLDMAYKLSGHYAPEKKEISGGLNLTALFDADDTARDEALEEIAAAGIEEASRDE